MTPLADDPELSALLALSERVGSDPTLVQGPGGNTSLKRDGILWIKASGTWLMNARREPIMVPVRIAPLLGAVARGEASAESAEAFVVAEENPRGLRPSIETTVHALMPQAIVVHVHCVETIASAITRHGEERLAGALAGLRFAYVPYVRPGLPLARAIASRLAPETDVLVLGNHGLVVAAETVAEAERLLEDVRGRLTRPVRPAPAPDTARLATIADGQGYRLPRHGETHGIATDAASLRIAALGSLYPDHVIFLGPGVTILQYGEPLAALVHRRTAEGLPPPTIVLVPGVGVLMHDSATPGAEELARCLALVLSRTDPDEEVVCLTAEQELELMSWDAEKYRQMLNAARS